MTLKDLFNSEHERARAAKTEGRELDPPGVAVTDADYLAECAALLKSALKSVDFESLLPRDYKLYWPDETICCLAVLPFNDGGYGKEEMQAEGKWDEFLERKSFLRLLSVMPLSKLTSGFGNVSEPAGRYHELLPEILKKDVSEGGCSFNVSYDDPFDHGNASDRGQFIAQCNQAFSNLKKFLGM